MLTFVFIGRPAFVSDAFIMESSRKGAREVWGWPITYLPTYTWCTMDGHAQEFWRTGGGRKECIPQGGWQWAT